MPAPVRRGAGPVPQALALAPLLRQVAGLAFAREPAEILDGVRQAYVTGVPATSVAGASPADFAY
jgi:hypothetical protein